MKITRVHVYAAAFAVSSLLARPAAAQKPGPAPTQKAQPVTEVDVSSELAAGGTAFGNGVTGPTITLSVKPAGITNSLLQNSSVTINTTAASGLTGGAPLSLGGSLSLGVATGGITNDMLAGAISPTKILGTAATLGANSFAADQSVTGNLSLTGNLQLPGTTSSSAGVIMFGANPFIHNYGTVDCNCVVGNTFVGQAAGNFSNHVSQTVSGNTGVGYSALSAVSSGNGNTGVGYLALGQTSSGFLNTAMGIEAMFSNTTGSNNVAIGDDALHGNIDGNDNVAVGREAGFPSGPGAPSTPSNSANIYIGNYVSGGVESNTIRIGRASTNDGRGFQNRAFIAGVSGVTTGGTAAAVVIDANGQLGTISSSRRFKYDIHDMGDASGDLLKLRPVRFRYKQAQNDGGHPLQYGLIAEEVASVYPELVQFDAKTGEPNTVLYHVLPTLLLNEFQKQHQVIQSQQDEIQSLRQQLQELAARTRDLQAQLAAPRSR
jgi:hypothetical protein